MFQRWFRKLRIWLDTITYGFNVTIKISASIRDIMILFGYDAALTEYLVAAWSNNKLFSSTSVKSACFGERDCNELELDILD